MFFFARRFIICLLICPLWVFSSHGVEIFAPHPVLNIEDHYCIAKQDGSSGCEEQSMDDQREEELDQLYKDQIVKYFSDIVFENAGCACQGNNGCTRGCRLVSPADGKQYPPIRKCEGKKSLRNSTSNCAKHVTGAIMTVVHNILADHCKNTDGGMLEDTIAYLQCLDNFGEDVKNNNTNICRHGFKFRFALCMLNLDGQSAHIYNKIVDKDVRSNCKNWDRYNQTLLSVNTSFYYGEITRIPLFKKISPEKNKEFQKNPLKIPKGAIIITKSEYGHVEVKTDRNECGKDKTQTCFCSDYCRERLRYSQSVLAVFEWNPEFIRYVSMNNIEYN